MPNTLKLEPFLKVNLFPPDTHFRTGEKNGLIQILGKITFGGKSLVIVNFQQTALGKINWGERKEESKRRAEGVF